MTEQTTEQKLEECMAMLRQIKRDCKFIKFIAKESDCDEITFMHRKFYIEYPDKINKLIPDSKEDFETIVDFLESKSRAMEPIFIIMHGENEYSFTNIFLTLASIYAKYGDHRKEAETFERLGDILSHKQYYDKVEYARAAKAYIAAGLPDEAERVMRK